MSQPKSYTVRTTKGAMLVVAPDEATARQKIARLGFEVLSVRLRVQRTFSRENAAWHPGDDTEVFD